MLNTIFSLCPAPPCDLSQLNVAEVMANDDLLDGEWDFEGEKTQGSLKMRLK